MFVFGDERQAAYLWADSLQFSYGPGPVKKHPDEMTERELRDAYVYAYGALNGAWQEDRSEEFLEALEEVYEELLRRFCEVSDIIPKAIESGVHVFPYPTESGMARQTAIAREASAN